ncbi:MAG TPA: putative 2OG-Fe(II) oxygenase [Gammaproteobacteria bacterium]|nr:putative 2OG-Fe(II) oxygenase [Gammaproteobacteria bacterium]
MNIKADASFEEHFPLTVMHSRHTGVADVNRAIAGILAGLRKQFLNDRDQNEALSGTITTYGGYQTSKKMMFLNRPEPEVQTLRDSVVQPGVQAYVDRVYGEQAKQIRTHLVSWANILAEGDWQAPHMHPTTGNIISGVYYAAVPEKPEPEGCIEFLNPHPVSRHHGESLTRRIMPKEGDLILFPPYYIHYVYPFRGPGERVIVAFDAIIQSTQFVF